MNRKLTISVSELVGKFVDHKIRTCGYSSISEYVRELIRLDQRFELARLDRPPVSERELDSLWRGAGT